MTISRWGKRVAAFAAAIVTIGGAVKMLSEVASKLNPWYSLFAFALLILIALAIDFVWQKWTGEILKTRELIAKEARERAAGVVNDRNRMSEIEARFVDFETRLKKRAPELYRMMQRPLDE